MRTQELATQVEELKVEKDSISSDYQRAKEADVAAYQTRIQEFEQRIVELEEDNKRLNEEKESADIEHQETKNFEEQEKVEMTL